MQRGAERVRTVRGGAQAFERDYLVRLLKITGGNVTQAARLAKRNRTEFYKLLQRHQLEPEDVQEPQAAG